MRAACAAAPADAGTLNAPSPQTPIDITDLNLTMRSMLRNRSGRPRCDDEDRRTRCCEHERNVARAAGEIGLAFGPIVGQHHEDSRPAHQAAHEQIGDDFPFPMRLLQQRPLVVRRRAAGRPSPADAPRSDSLGCGGSSVVFTRGLATRPSRPGRARRPSPRPTRTRPADASTAAPAGPAGCTLPVRSVSKKNALRSPTDVSSSTP